VSEQQEEESLRRWAREQAEIERQADALVLKSLTAMVAAADDLKSKLRRDEDLVAAPARSESSSPSLDPAATSPTPAVVEPEESLEPDEPVIAERAPDGGRQAAATPTTTDPSPAVPSPGASAPPSTATSAPASAPASPPVAESRPIAPPSRPAPVRRRLVELVFGGVPGHQQASALELAVTDLVPDGDVDIVEFERGQLVLSAQATDLEGLADQLVTGVPASLALEGVTGDRATFRCL
jgi:hypothetical protein